VAAGRPLVARVDPGTEAATVDEQAGAGLVVPPGDADALADALRRLVAAPEEREQMGAAGRRFVESWPSPADVAERYDLLFQELLAGT
jgi:colanic acid biosynthesis glycosyl transferase WcaI